jgi:hypothetical protein
MTNRKIEALQEAATQKAKNSAERVDKAIEKMYIRSSEGNVTSNIESVRVACRRHYKFACR